MATNNEPSSTNPDNPPGSASPRRSGGRGRGRGGPRTFPDDGHDFAPRGRGRGGHRGGGRGRGVRDDGNNRNVIQSERSLEKAPATNGQSAELAQADPITSKEADGAESVADPDDGEICFICASVVQHTAIAPCNHRTCHVCSLRMRALYKIKACAHCRTESDWVIFTDDANKDFEAFTPDSFYSTLDSLGIRFESQDILVDTEVLLRYNCPDSTCDVACLGWPDLFRHVQTAHGKKMCDLCTRNKKAFTHEHELFTQADLTKHKKFGDDNPGAVDQSGFTGHPECGFCRQRFFGDDELYTHCKMKHERCHICDRRNEGRKQQYFVDYNALAVHFRKEHFVCPDQECLDKKLIVFDSEMDLKAHQLEVHPNGLSKDALRDARRVDMSGFQIRASHEQERGERRGGDRREGRGRGRGRDPNAEPLPQSSAQPMSRAELAFARQMAIQDSTSATSRTFGGQLTSSPTPGEAFAARAPSSAAEPTTVTASRPRGAVNDVTNNVAAMNIESQPTSNAPRTPQEQARQLRHSAIIERASNMLRNDQTKLAEFRNHISAYRTSKLSATQMIDVLFSLFDTSSADLGKLVKELADIFEIPSKRDDLLKAWNDWRAINEDYPSLPGATVSSLSGNLASRGGSRVLKLKSSTAQSSRSAVSRKASWAGASSNTPFPPLSASASSSRIGAKPGQTPWASSVSSSTRPSPMLARATPSVAVNKAKAPVSADAFPSLPAAPKPTSTIFTPGYTGTGLRRDNSSRNTTTNAWAPAAEASNTSAVPEDDVPGGKKKGNKNKKQTLYHFG